MAFSMPWDGMLSLELLEKGGMLLATIQPG